MGPMDLRRFFSWTSVVDEERPSMETVQRSLSAPLWLCLVDIGRPRPIWPPPLPRPRPDTTTYTNARCEKNCRHDRKIRGKGYKERRRKYFSFSCLNRHVDVLILHSTVWRGAIPFLSTKENFKNTVFLSHLSDVPHFHMIDLSYFYIGHQRQNMMHVAWHIFIWACEWEVCFFSCRGRGGGGRDPEKRGGRENMCACVLGRGSIKREEPCKRHGGCLTLSASVSMVTVTAAWWWQACREARGPCVAPRVTLLSACQYSCTWHTVLSYYHYCSIAMSTECQGSASGTGQLYRRHFIFFYMRTAITPQSALLIYIFPVKWLLMSKAQKVASPHLWHTLFCCGLPMPPRLACGVPPGPCCCCPAMVTFLWTPWLSAVAGQVPCCCAGPPVASGPFPLWMMRKTILTQKLKIFPAIILVCRLHKLLLT